MVSARRNWRHKDDEDNVSAASALLIMSTSIGDSIEECRLKLERMLEMHAKLERKYSYMKCAFVRCVRGHLIRRGEAGHQFRNWGKSQPAA